MIKEPQMVPGKQNVLSRQMFVIREREELLRFADGFSPSQDGWDRGPFVVTTEEVPYKGDLEGWSLAIQDKNKEAFLRDKFDYFPLSVIGKPDDLFEKMEVLVAFFDKCWTAERVAGYVEILRGKWKTRLCDGATAA